jgi:putative restriction endonuclease
MNNYALLNRMELEKSNYVRVASPDTNYWVDFHQQKMKEYELKFGDSFKLIIIGDKNKEGDYYAIPYWLIKSMFTEQSLYVSPRHRWVASINFHQLNVRKNHQSIDVGIYYGVIEQPYQNEGKFEGIGEQQGDYAIENRKLEIKARQKQSLFRTKVLNNFNLQCCLSDTVEEDLLIASHIIPWADRIQSRLDPSNGLCLSYVYDKLFDEGYFSLGNDLRVMTTDRAVELSHNVQETLLSIEGEKIHEPRTYPIATNYLEYHRMYRFKK